MPQPIASAARSLAVAALLGTVALASPLPAAADQPVAPAQLAQATPPASPPDAATTKKPRRSRADRVEQRITMLHEALKITPDQETQWNAVAQAMRDHAGLMQQAIDRRAQNPNMTAVDDLKAYEGIAEANAQGMQKLVPAFETLYASLSDDQKKEADVLFAHSRHQRKSSKKPQ